MASLDGKGSRILICQASKLSHQFYSLYSVMWFYNCFKMEFFFYLIEQKEFRIKMLVSRKREILQTVQFRDVDRYSCVYASITKPDILRRLHFIYIQIQSSEYYQENLSPLRSIKGQLHSVKIFLFFFQSEISDFLLYFQ